MPRDVEAFELLAEVLDHVVALGLAVDQHVEAELFLQRHDALDLVLHELPRTRLPSMRPRASLARAGRTSRRSAGRSRWSSSAAAAGPAARPAARVARRTARRGCRRPRSARDAARSRSRRPPRRRRAARRCACRPRRCSAATAARPSVRPSARVTISASLLVGEGEPGAQLRIELRLQLDVVRARGAASRTEPTDGALGAPFAVDALSTPRSRRGRCARRCGRRSRRRRASCRRAARASAVVEVAAPVTRSRCKAVDRRRAAASELVAERAEVGGEHQLGPLAGGQRARRPWRSASSSRPACGRARGTARRAGPSRRRRRRARQQLRIDRQEPSSRSAGEAGRCVVGACASSRNVTGPTSTGRVSTPSARGASTYSRAVVAASAKWSGAELRHEVVVVGVEPLGHLERRHRWSVAARHGEVGVEIDRPWPEACRSGPARRRPGGGVEHMVVEREVVAGMAAASVRPRPWRPQATPAEALAAASSGCRVESCRPSSPRRPS